MQAFIYFSCIGYECQTSHLKKGMRQKGYAPPAYPFRSRSWLNPQPSEKIPFEVGYTFRFLSFAGFNIHE